MPRRPRHPAASLAFHSEVALPPHVRVLARRCLTAAAAGRRYSSISLALVTPATMRQLNRTYRRHDSVTDVLSFTYQVDPPGGEVVICPAQARAQARKRRHSLERELAVLMVHGLMHVAGYDHVKLAERRVMRAAERQVLARLGRADKDKR